MVCEIAGGIIAKSFALLTDAADLASDSAGFVINIVAIRYSKRKRSKKLTFGYLKAESLGAFVSIILIWALYTILIYESVMAIFVEEEEDEDVNANIMLGFSLTALALNIFKICILGGHSHGGEEDHGGKPKGEEPIFDHGRIKAGLGGHGKKKSGGGGHGHGGGGGHGAKGGEGEEEESAGLKIAIINVGGDVIKSFGVFVISLIIKFKEDWAILDPCYTIVISIFVIFSTFGLFG